MSFILFFVLWATVLGLLYFYAGRRLIGPSTLGTRGRWLAWTGVLIAFLLPLIPFFFFLKRIESTLTDDVAWAGYAVLGLFSLVVTFVALRDAVFGGWRVAGRIGRLRARGTARETVNQERRTFLIRSSNLGILGASASLAAYGAYESHRRPDIVRVSVALPRLPVEFEGCTLAQFSDIHVGPTIKRALVERVVHELRELHPEMILFTGDLVDGTVPWLRDDVAPLADLHAPSGKYFVTGNHEYYSGVGPWVEHASRLGFIVLMNEHRVIARGRGRIVLAGVTDYGAAQFAPDQASDPVAALHGAPEGLVRILMAHQPRSIFAAATAGVDLQLSGHTHGGQFFPWNYLATLNQPYITGLHRHGSTQIYVNRGTGYWGPPLRLGIPPEITLITLSRDRVSS